MYGRPMNGASLCVYLRRKPNAFGGSLGDFLEPVYFLGRKETVSKSSVGIGGIYMANSQTYFRAESLPLSASEMKKDDAIAQVSSRNDLILSDLRLWLVESAECLTDELTLRYGSEEEDERHAPKRMAVQ
jgi:hypothetical protein